MPHFANYLCALSKIYEGAIEPTRLEFSFVYLFILDLETTDSNPVIRDAHSEIIFWQIQVTDPHLEIVDADLVITGSKDEITHFEQINTLK